MPVNLQHDRKISHRGAAEAPFRNGLAHLFTSDSFSRIPSVKNTMLTAQAAHIQLSAL
jgi:hypothetical protein